MDQGGKPGTYPINPNGSVSAIAGLTDETGQVLGLMPRPERHVHLTYHSCWPRLYRNREADGIRLFQTAAANLR